MLDDLKTLRLGDMGPQVSLLQLGLSRRGELLTPDGIFGNNTYTAVLSFQSQTGLKQDGIAGPRTWEGLMPWLTGYLTHVIRRGDTIYRLAQRYDTTISLLETANPGLNPYNLPVGRTLVIPLDFPVVPDSVPFTSTVLALCVEGLRMRFPFLTTGTLGDSVMGKPLWYLRIGTGQRQVLFNAAHHANEWITGPVVLRFLERYAGARAAGGAIAGIPAASLYEATSLFVVPLVNPDGVDLITGELDRGPYYTAARRLGENYPGISFPAGWKANIEGIDPNLQYPAGWEEARRIKAAQGYTRPGPRDYVGTAPLEAPESRALYRFSLHQDFRLTLSYHTQGRVIYWRYLDYEPENADTIAEAFGQVSGYTVSDTPYASGFAGYKDWFIQNYNRPGYTIEAGLGTAPLPLSQFDEIYGNNEGIMAGALAAVRDGLA